MNTKVADAGFQNVAYKGATWVYDGGIDGAAPAGTIFGINTDYLDLVVDPRRNFSTEGGAVKVPNQDVEITSILFRGNLVASGMIQHFRMFN